MEPQPAREMPATVRKTPVQARSRERFERMLDAAIAIIGETGSDTMRMSEVAERAGVPIGSLYQFFPDKAAIVRTLAERVNEESRRCIEGGLAGLSDKTGLATAFAALLDDYYALFLDQPVMRDIWSAMQADRTLRKVQLEESRRNAAILAEALEKVMPGSPPDILIARSLVVMHLGEEAMRMAISVDRAEGDRILEIYKKMAVRELVSEI